MSTLLIIKPKQSEMERGAALIATLKVFACDSNGNSVKVRAMSDGGSHMTMISSRLVQLLKLKPTELMIPLQPYHWPIHCLMFRMMSTCC